MLFLGIRMSKHHVELAYRVLLVPDMKTSPSCSSCYLQTEGDVWKAVMLVSSALITFSQRKLAN